MYFAYYWKPYSTFNLNWTMDLKPNSNFTRKKKQKIIGILDQIKNLLDRIQKVQSIKNEKRPQN